jgi:NTP pyrophosphatase (non-canonical NTP hydrolase)
MNFVDYQPLAAKTAVYPHTVPDFGMAYCALKLNGEVSELGEKVDALATAPEAMREDMTEAARKEAGDVYWYIANLGLEGKLTLRDVATTPPDAFASAHDCTVALSRWAGAVAESIGKAYRDDGGTLTDKRQAAIQQALDDMLLGLAWLTRTTLGTTVEAVLAANIAKLHSRQQRGQIHGSGDER